MATKKYVSPSKLSLFLKNLNSIFAAKDHTHSYAGASSAGGAATSANKLNTNAGSVTQPVFFKDGIPVATTYTLGKSVPSDAKFTDTTYPAATTSSPGLMSASDKSKLDGIASSATKVSVDSALSSSSTNPVQNKVVNSALAGKATKSIYTVTLGTNWAGSGPYTQTVSVSGVLSSDNPHIFPQYSSTSSTAISQKEDWNKIDNAVSNNGSITFTCFENKPSNPLSLIIEVIR